MSHKYKMTLQDAICILNEKKHDFENENNPDYTWEWQLEINEGGAELMRYITEYKNNNHSRGERYYNTLTAFECIAVAEKYAREANES